MSEIKWTKAQQNAIDYHKSSLVVSAAAGSGKTAVLVERIIKMLEYTDIDRLLVVTFTQAAASQMRESIAEALEKYIRSDIDENKKQLYHRQLLLLPGANISTMHSFCSKVIKDNFDKLDLSPDFTLIEPDQGALLLTQSAEQLMDEEYEAGNEDFLNFARNYSSYKNDSAIPALLLKVHKFSRSVPYAHKWYKSVIKGYENPYSLEWIEEYYKKATDALNRALLYAEKVLAEINDTLKSLNPEDELSVRILNVAEKHILPLIDADIIALNSCLECCKDYESTFDAAYSIKFKNFPTIKDNADKELPFLIKAKEQRGIFKGIISNAKDTYLGFSLEQLSDFSKLQLPHIKELIRLTVRLDELFTEKKRSLNMLDFNDLEHLCISLLTDENGNPTECAEKLSEEFDEIIVDEYQDTNDVQETIINAISKNKSNIFMVGDIKQSIYRFRNTAPEIFLSKTETFSDEDSENGKRIFLSSNFRSRKNILDFSNLVFGQVMCKDYGEIDYGENEALYYGANYEGNDSPVDITVIEKNEYTDFSGIEQECAVIAQKINSMIESGFKVTDKKTKELRPVTYKDFAILLRTSKNISDEMASFLTNCGIPVYNDGGKELLLSSIEVQTVISYLKIIDNPYSDIPLIGVLRSSIYSVSDDLLMEITKSSKIDISFYEKLLTFENPEITAFLADLEYYKKQASILSLYELCNLIIKKNMIMEFSAAMPGGTQRVLNLRYLLSLADKFDKNSGGGLFSFLVYIENFSSHSQNMTSPKVLPDSSNVVTMTTMHKSKGLEYPVVIIPTLGRAFKNLDLTSNILIHKKLGIGFDYIDAINHTKIPSPVRTAISGKTKDEFLSEELRVLYVALTRAKEKLILIGAVEEHEKAFENLSNALNESEYKLPVHITKSAKNPIMLILLAVMRHKASENILQKSGYQPNTITDLSDIDLTFVKNIEFSGINTKNTDVDFTPCEISPDIREKLEYKVPDLGQGVFSKYSVSELKRYIENETDHKDFFEKLISLSDVNAPSVLSAAQKGIAIHKVFEFIDFSYTASADKIKEYVEKLTQKGILTFEEEKLIPYDKMYAFFSSEIGQKLINSDFVKREVPFNIHISEDFENIAKGGLKVQLQGVIDCYFKDSAGFTIIDFKSDKITAENKEEKINSYKKQLEFYIMALKTMYSDAPVKGFIYFLDDNSVIPV